MEAVTRAAGGLPNFAIDDSGSRYMDLYARTELLVSDFSSTAYSFAFATLRPVLFYSVNEERLQAFIAEKSGDRFCENRLRLGMVACDIPDLITKARIMLADVGAFREGIRALRDENCFNVGNSERYLADNLDCVFDGSSRADWLYFRGPATVV